MPNVVTFGFAAEPSLPTPIPPTPLTTPDPLAPDPLTPDPLTPNLPPTPICVDPPVPAHTPAGARQEALSLAEPTGALRVGHTASVAVVTPRLTVTHLTTIQKRYTANARDQNGQ